MKDYHCCATCQHFKTEKRNDGMMYFCSRLGYQTKTTYKFNCWSPKEHIRRLMEKENDRDNLTFSK